MATLGGVADLAMEMWRLVCMQRKRDQPLEDGRGLRGDMLLAGSEPAWRA